jgi:hypothetical protein
MSQPFFAWLNELATSVAIRESVWFYAFIQAIHLVALGVFSGAVLMVDLRLLGAGFSRQPLAQVARDARPWFIWGFIALFITGFPQLMSNAMREYFSDFFWMKMEFMVVALIFTFTVRHRVTMAAEGRIAPVWAKTTGLVSIGLWLGVAIPARLIGLFT